MTRPSLEETLTKVFGNTVRSILLAQLQSDRQVSVAFYSAEVNRQRELEEQVSVQSEKIARDIVAKLKQADYIERDPPQDFIARIIKETLLEHGVGKLES